MFVISDSHISMIECQLIHNSASFGGGGMFVQTSSCNVSSSVCDQNTATTGGAIYLLGSTAEVSATEFTNNGQDGCLQGGAISGSSSTLHSKDSTYAQNSVSFPCLIPPPCDHCLMSVGGGRRRLMEAASLCHRVCSCPAMIP